MPRDKSRRLQDSGCRHRHPGRVHDPLFEQLEFFDPEDLVQVKYEMLRRVQVEKDSASRAVETFGFSRPSFYQAQEQFQHEGLVGLVPKKRGPKGGHKLTDEVVDFVLARLAEDSSLSSDELVAQLQEHFGLTVHSRSIERALARRKKNST